MKLKVALIQHTHFNFQVLFQDGHLTGMLNIQNIIPGHAHSYEIHPQTQTLE